MLANQILLGLVFLFGTGFTVVNGMNDISGVVGSLCASRALSVQWARLLAICGIWTGIIVGSDAVSKTVALGLAELSDRPTTSALLVWLSALLGSIAWVLLARRLNIPTSSTHTFMGALCGATIASTMEWQRVNWGLQTFVGTHQVVGVMKVFLGLILSPAIGGSLGYVIFRLLSLSLRRATTQVNAGLRYSEVVVVFGQSLTYGLNDAHTALGILAGASLCLYPTSSAIFTVSWPIKLIIGAALAVGTLLGSQGIMRTMGRGLYIVRPAEALAGQAGAALAVLGAAQVGAPRQFIPGDLQRTGRRGRGLASPSRALASGPRYFDDLGDHLPLRGRDRRAGARNFDDDTLAARSNLAMSFFNRKGPDFRQLLSGQLAFATSALLQLEAWCQEPSQAIVEEIFRLETAADQARMTLTKTLATAFETPLDREDLDDLSRRIDDVIDQVRHVVRAGAALKVKPVQAIREMVVNVQNGVKEIEQSLQFLPRLLDQAKLHAGQARRPLRLNERLYSSGVAELFDHEDVRQIFRQMEIFRSVIALSECLEDVADILDHAINKLS